MVVVRAGAADNFGRQFPSHVSLSINPTQQKSLAAARFLIFPSVHLCKIEQPCICQQGIEQGHYWQYSSSSFPRSWSRSNPIQGNRDSDGEAAAFVDTGIIRSTTRRDRSRTTNRAAPPTPTAACMQTPSVRAVQQGSIARCTCARPVPPPTTTHGDGGCVRTCAAPRDPIPMPQVDQVKRNIQGPGRSGLIDSKHDSRNIRVCFSFIILIYLQGK